MTDSLKQPHSAEGQITELRTRVLGVENGMLRIESMVAGLGAKFDAKSQTPWAVIWSAAGVVFAMLLGVGSLAYAPISKDQERVSSHLERLAETAVTDRDLDKRLDISGARRDDWQRGAEKAVEANRQHIDKLENEVVPRGEHEEHWRAVDRQFADVQRQVDEQKKFQSDLYSARDIIRDLNERTKTLELQALRTAPTH
ncbi:hypothetical protein [Lichenihabitans psoromatis]|uniref:hypothetical protein n=1 Tax=Lichenihabitans psoromatis TaxID=2528642 RepID=UPI0010364210|nr:hypothetical protein [Lichenihabitans psoromatis]